MNITKSSPLINKTAFASFHSEQPRPEYTCLSRFTCFHSIFFTRGVQDKEAFSSNASHKGNANACIFKDYVYSGCLYGCFNFASNNSKKNKGMPPLFNWTPIWHTCFSWVFFRCFFGLFNKNNRSLTVFFW